jgi:hypothetical protein
MPEKENYSYQLFNVRLDKARYLIVKGWWLERGWDIPAIDSLSTTGLMIYHKGRPVCAGWLYQTDSLMAVIGFVIGDSKTVGKVKKQSVKFLLTELERIAKELGFKSIFLPIAADSVARLGTNYLNYTNSGKTNELAKIIA